MIIISIIWLIAINSNAQEQDSLSYSVIEDNPHNITDIQVFIMPAYLSFFMYPEAGLSIGGNALIKEKIGLDVSYVIPYLYAKGYGTFPNLHNYGENYFKPSRYLNLGAEFIIKDKDKEKPLEVELKWVRDEKNTRKTIIKAKGTQRQILKIRTGIFLYNHPIVPNIYVNLKHIMGKLGLLPKSAIWNQKMG